LQASARDPFQVTTIEPEVILLAVALSAINPTKLKSKLKRWRCIKNCNPPFYLETSVVMFLRTTTNR
jgi:hypothetical protein